MSRWSVGLLFLLACGSSGTSPLDGSVPDGSQSDVASVDGGDGGPITPTVSSWVGTNVSADLPYVDIAYLLSPFNTPTAQLDANGYPVAGASGTSATDVGYLLTSGTYKIAYQGTGTLTVSGIGKLGGAWTQANGEMENTVTITGTPGAFGNFLNLQVTNATGQTVTSIRILYPGFDYTTTQIFLPQFLALMTPFRALRFMDWEATNNSTLANWTDRPASAHFGHSQYGEPYEHIAALVNQTGKDCWITIPEHATDAFIQSFAQFMRQNLDFNAIATARAAQGFTTPFELIVEDANETWNGGFTAYNTFLTAAQANATRYPGTYTGSFGPSWMTSNKSLMQVGEYHGDRLVKIANDFKTAMTDQAAAVKPVLSGWALGPGYSDASLTFIKANYGDPKTLIAYVAIAPYFATPDDTTTGSLSTLFPALGTAITAMNPTMQQFTQLSTTYGLPIVAYEGGQSLTGTTNQTIKHLAQFDARMHDVYVQYMSFWKQNFGKSLFMHFALAGDLGLPENIYQYGYWWSIPSVLSDPATCGANLPTLTGTETPSAEASHCPKYQALGEQVP